jgi:glutaredoxin
MPIIFYSMPGCGHCIEAKSKLGAEIKSGKIIEKDYLNAPNEVRGFPYFTNGEKSIVGFPRSKENLFTQLGYSGREIKKKKLNIWQNFLKNNGGKGWSINKMKNEYKKNVDTI